jgi:hypothetical protein
MTIINFNPNGGPLSVEIRYQGPIIAEYTYRLRAASTNATVRQETGDNDNEDDDIYVLPTPISNNNDRKITVGSDFASADGTENNVKWVTNVIVFQDNKELGRGTDKGTYPKDDQSFVIIKLKSAE